MIDRVAGRIAAASVVALSMGLAAAPAHAGEKIPNAWICVFKPNAVAKADVAGRANAAANAQGGAVTHVYKAAIRGFSANMSETGMTNMRRNNASIAYCEQDQVMTVIAAAKGKPGGGGTTTQPAQETPWGIARVNGGAAGQFATAWIIDTGIQFDHPDLNVDTARSRSFLSRGDAQDENGHGTHVSGTIAALDNSIGVIGVAPGAPVVAVRVLDRRGSGSNSGVIAGVDYVAQNGKPGDVANMSLGGGVSAALDDAVVNAAATGVRFALAAGNESDDANNHSPARANGANIYTVSAFARGDTWASFSNYGNPPVDYAEPGVSIKSTWIGSGYNTISGTSMATPHLAGLLLAGGIRSGGTVFGDPDGKPDTIGVH